MNKIPQATIDKYSDEEGRASGMAMAALGCSIAVDVYMHFLSVPTLGGVMASVCLFALSVLFSAEMYGARATANALEAVNENS